MCQPSANGGLGDRNAQPDVTVGLDRTLSRAQIGHEAVGVAKTTQKSVSVRVAALVAIDAGAQAIH